MSLYHGFVHIDGDELARSGDAVWAPFWKWLEAYWSCGEDEDPRVVESTGEELWQPLFEKLCARALGSFRSDGTASSDAVSVGGKTFGKVVVSMLVPTQRIRRFLERKVEEQIIVAANGEGGIGLAGSAGAVRGGQEPVANTSFVFIQLTLSDRLHGERQLERRLLTISEAELKERWEEDPDNEPFSREAYARCMGERMAVEEAGGEAEKQDRSGGNQNPSVCEVDEAGPREGGATPFEKGSGATGRKWSRSVRIIDATQTSEAVLSQLRDILGLEVGAEERLMTSAALVRTVAEVNYERLRASC